MAYDTEDVPSLADWLQGDIVKQRLRNGVDEFFVIITADCDIAQKKTGPAGLACLRARPLAEYMLEVHSQSVADRELKRTVQRLTKNVNERLQRDKPRTPLSHDTIHQWFYYGQLEDILARLQLNESGARGLADDIATAYHATQAAKARDGYWAIDVVKQLKKHPDRQAAVKAICRDLGPHSLPMHLFFVSALPAETHLGYLVDLRDLRFVTDSQLFRSWMQAQTSPDPYVRVARLKTTHRHALARDFANLYGRIGFDDEFTVERDETFELCITDLLRSF